jgi:RimJ/RimL family protein N-acetyltransferase
VTETTGPGEPLQPIDPVAGSSVVLADGSNVAIVPMQATDSARLMRFHGTLSAETTYSRFFSFHPELTSKELDRFTHVDHRDREAIVALAGDEIVGVARFDRMDDAMEAEVAFVVADSWQGRGIGSLLFERLARRAVDTGVTRFVADTLPYNQRMLAVFRHSDLPITERVEEGVVHLTLQLVPA